MTKSEFAEILTRATEGDHAALDNIFFICRSSINTAL